MDMKEINHVHTYRCKHSDIDEVILVEKCIEKGIDKITFTDHAPFPGNPFGHRMDYEELKSYIKNISELKEKYKGNIDIICGLEVEYLPSFEDYYKELKGNAEIDTLYLGQHMYELEPGVYSYSFDRTMEFLGLTDAMVKGAESGYFDVIAHPDRCFRRHKVWTDEIALCAKKIIDAAIENKLLLEQNETSKRKTNHYREEFWNMVQDESIIIHGYDLHYMNELFL